MMRARLPDLKTELFVMLNAEKDEEKYGEWSAEDRVAIRKTEKEKGGLRSVTDFNQSLERVRMCIKVAIIENKRGVQD